MNLDGIPESVLADEMRFLLNENIMPHLDQRKRMLENLDTWDSKKMYECCRSIASYVGYSVKRLERMKGESK